MTIPVTFFIALACALVSYSQNQGGGVAGSIFFFVLFIGVFIHVARPMFEMIGNAMPKRSSAKK